MRNIEEVAIDTTELTQSQVQNPQSAPIAQEPVFRRGPFGEAQVMTGEENKNYVESAVDKTPESYPPQSEPVSVLAGFKKPEQPPPRPDHTPISPLPFVQEPPVIFPRHPDIQMDEVPGVEKGKELTLEDAKKIVNDLSEDLQRLSRQQELSKDENTKREEKRKLAAVVWKRLRPLIAGATLLGLALFAKEKVADVNQSEATGAQANEPVAEQFNPNLQTPSESALSDINVPDVSAPSVAQAEKPLARLLDYTIQPGDSLSSIIARLNPARGYLDESGVFKTDDATQAQLYNDVADVIGENPQILEWNPDLARVIVQETQSLGAPPRGLDLKAAVGKAGGPNEIVEIRPGAIIKVPSQTS